MKTQSKPSRLESKPKKTQSRPSKPESKPRKTQSRLSKPESRPSKPESKQRSSSKLKHSSAGQARKRRGTRVKEEGGVLNGAPALFLYPIHRNAEKELSRKLGCRFSQRSRKVTSYAKAEGLGVDGGPRRTSAQTCSRKSSEVVGRAVARRGREGRLGEALAA